MFKIHEQYKIKKKLIFMIFIFFLFYLKCYIFKQSNSIVGLKMNKIKTPDWYNLFIKDKNDVDCIKNIILSSYEELISKLLLLKDVLINKENADILFDKSYQLFEDYKNNIQKYFSILHIYYYLGTDSQIQNDIQRVLNEINIFYIENFIYNIEIYNIFNLIGSFFLNNILIKNNKKRLIESHLNAYKRIGIHLSEEKKKRIKEIDIILNDICMQFQMNIQSTNNHIIVNKNDLLGLSDFQLARLNKIDSDNFKIGVDYPTYSMIMGYCYNAEIRKNLYKEFNTRAFPENFEILDKIRSLNNEKAKILGYENYPQFDLENQMAKNVNAVYNLLNKINEATKLKAQEEKRILTLFAQKELFKDDEYKIHPWDSSFISNAYEKSILT